MKTVLDWILNEDHINALFLWAAIAGPIVGLLAGAAYAKITGKPLGRALLQGGVLGAFGTLNGLMWMLYNRVTDHYGLDTVKNLLMNLAIFATVGVFAGLALRFVFKGGEAPPESLEEKRG